MTGLKTGTSIVTATVKTIPGITSVTPDSICNADTVHLSATASSGTIMWYANSTAGSSINTGSSYAPFISQTTTF